jgi:4-hydroxy-tetrahydrodipicolinate reductase
VHRVVIEGLPSLTIDLCLGGADGGDRNNQGLVATAMRLVNAVPAVVAAPPGIVTPLDVKLGMGRSLMPTEGGHIHL